MKLCDTDHDEKISKEEFEKLQKVLVRLMEYAESHDRHDQIPDIHFHTRAHHSVPVAERKF